MNYPDRDRTSQLSGPFPQTLSELYEQGKKVLPLPVLEYLEEGAGEEQTLHDNRRSFGQLSVLPRYLSGVSQVSTRCSILGTNLAAPILTAPIGGDGLFHPRGGLAIAQAASDLELLPMVAQASTFSLEEYARECTGSRIAQVHAWGTINEALDHARRATDLGCIAMCISIDCPTLGIRDRSRSRGFAVAPNYYGSDQAVISRLASGEGSSWTWRDIEKFVQACELPCIIKGIITGSDAKAAANAGARVIFLSNHGGRQLDGLPATLHQLAEVAAAIGPEQTLVVDGGVRRGLDIFKALALGADAVVVGRPVVRGLAAFGYKGVHAVLKLLVLELERAMLLAGVPTVGAFSPDLVVIRR